jgi:hypothetical protein
VQQTRSKATFSLDRDAAGSVRSLSMIHKGVEYSVSPAAPGVWMWQFQIGDKVKTGRTEARLQLLAIRRVQLRIDRELKKVTRERPGSDGTE